jgi:hypothetical protein
MDKKGYLFWFWVITFIVIAGLSVYIAGEVQASPMEQGTPNTPNTPQITWGATGTQPAQWTPTMYVSPTPRSALPCTVMPTMSTTPMWGYPTVNLPTSELGTPQSSITPVWTVTSTPSMSNTFKVKVDLSNSGNPGLHGAGNYVACWSDTEGQSSVTMVDGGGNSGMTVTGHVVECLGSLAVSDTSHNWTRYLDTKFSVESSSQSNLSVYYSYDYNVDGAGTHSGEGEGFGTDSLSTTLWHIFGEPKILYGNGVSGSGTVYAYLKVQQYGFDATPTPWVRQTDVPCSLPPDYHSYGQEIANFDIQYQWGGCSQFLPESTIKLGGWRNLPDLGVPGVTFCIMWMTINAQVFGLSIDLVLIPLIVLGFGFAIYNEFRS